MHACQISSEQRTARYWLHSQVQRRAKSKANGGDKRYAYQGAESKLYLSCKAKAKLLYSTTLLRNLDNLGRYECMPGRKPNGSTKGNQEVW